MGNAEILRKVTAEGLGPARVVDLSFSWTGARPMMRWSQYLYQKDLLRKENERMVKVAADLNQMVTRMEKTERMVVKQTREDEKMVKVAADLSRMVIKIEKTEKMVTVAADPDQIKKKERVMVRKRCLKGLIKKVVEKTREDEKMVKVAASLSQIQIVKKMVKVAADPDQIKKNEKVMERKRYLKGLIKKSG